MMADSSVWNGLDIDGKTLDSLIFGKDKDGKGGKAPLGMAEVSKALKDKILPGGAGDGWRPRAGSPKGLWDLLTLPLPNGEMLYTDPAVVAELVEFLQKFVEPSKYGGDIVIAGVNGDTPGDDKLGAELRDATDALRTLFDGIYGMRIVGNDPNDVPRIETDGNGEEVEMGFRPLLKSALKTDIIEHFANLDWSNGDDTEYFSARDPNKSGVGLGRMYRSEPGAPAPGAALSSGAQLADACADMARYAREYDKATAALRRAAEIRTLFNHLLAAEKAARAVGSELAALEARGPADPADAKNAEALRARKAARGADAAAARARLAEVGALDAAEQELGAERAKELLEGALAALFVAALAKREIDKIASGTPGGKVKKWNAWNACLALFDPNVVPGAEDRGKIARGFLDLAAKGAADKDYPALVQSVLGAMPGDAIPPGFKFADRLKDAIGGLPGRFGELGWPGRFKALTVRPDGKGEIARLHDRMIFGDEEYKAELKELRKLEAQSDARRRLCACLGLDRLGEDDGFRRDLSLALLADDSLPSGVSELMRNLVERAGLRSRAGLDDWKCLFATSDKDELAAMGFITTERTRRIRRFNKDKTPALDEHGRQIYDLDYVSQTKMNLYSAIRGLWSEKALEAAVEKAAAAGARRMDPAGWVAVEAVYDRDCSEERDESVPVAIRKREEFRDPSTGRAGKWRLEVEADDGIREVEISLKDESDPQKGVYNIKDPRIAGLLGPSDGKRSGRVPKDVGKEGALVETVHEEGDGFSYYSGDPGARLWRNRRPGQLRVRFAPVYDKAEFEKAKETLDLLEKKCRLPEGALSIEGPRPGRWMAAELGGKRLRRAWVEVPTVNNLPGIERDAARLLRLACGPARPADVPAPMRAAMDEPEASEELKAPEMLEGGIRCLKATYDTMAERLDDFREKNKGIQDRINNATEMGDTSDNADYRSAREDQGQNYSNYKRLKKEFDNAVVVSTVAPDRIGFGTWARLQVDGKEQTYQILGRWEADLADEDRRAERKSGSGGAKVVNHMAPLFRPLAGMRAGGSREVEVGGVFHKVEVLEVRALEERGLRPLAPKAPEKGAEPEAVAEELETQEESAEPETTTKELETQEKGAESEMATKEPEAQEKGTEPEMATKEPEAPEKGAELEATTKESEAPVKDAEPETVDKEPEAQEKSAKPEMATKEPEAPEKGMDAEAARARLVEMGALDTGQELDAKKAKELMDGALAELFVTTLAEREFAEASNDYDGSKAKEEYAELVGPAAILALFGRGTEKSGLLVPPLADVPGAEDRRTIAKGFLELGAKGWPNNTYLATIGAVLGSVPENIANLGEPFACCLEDAMVGMPSHFGELNWRGRFEALDKEWKAPPEDKASLRAAEIQALFGCLMIAEKAPRAVDGKSAEPEAPEKAGKPEAKAAKKPETLEKAAEPEAPKKTAEPKLAAKEPKAPEKAAEPEVPKKTAEPKTATKKPEAPKKAAEPKLAAKEPEAPEKAAEPKAPADAPDRPLAIEVETAKGTFTRPLGTRGLAVMLGFLPRMDKATHNALADRLADCGGRPPFKTAEGLVQWLRANAGCASEAWKAGDVAASITRQDVLDALELTRDAGAKMRAVGGFCVTPLDADYPADLRALGADRPPVLWCAGKDSRGLLGDRACVLVAGESDPPGPAFGMARGAGGTAARTGATVVSGSDGCGQAALEEALRLGGTGIVILPMLNLEYGAGAAAMKGAGGLVVAMAPPLAPETAARHKEADLALAAFGGQGVAVLVHDAPDGYSKELLEKAAEHGKRLFVVRPEALGPAGRGDSLNLKLLLADQDIPTLGGGRDRSGGWRELADTAWEQRLRAMAPEAREGARRLVWRLGGLGLGSGTLESLARSGWIARGGWRAGSAAVLDWLRREPCATKEDAEKINGLTADGMAEVFAWRDAMMARLDALGVGIRSVYDVYDGGFVWKAGSTGSVCFLKDPADARPLRGLLEQVRGEVGKMTREELGLQPAPTAAPPPWRPAPGAEPAWYCYANKNGRAVELSAAAHDPNSPFLLGLPRPGDVVEERRIGMGRMFEDAPARTAPEAPEREGKPSPYARGGR